MNSFWGNEEPPEDNDPRYTVDERTSRATATRAAAPSSAEAFFGLPVSSQKASKTIGSKVREAISSRLNPGEARAQRIGEAVRGLLNALEGRGKLTVQVAMDDVLKECGDAPQAFLREFTAAVEQRVNTKTMTATELEALHACVDRVAARRVDVQYLRAVSDSAARGLESLNPALSPSLQTGLLSAMRQPEMDPFVSETLFNDALSEANRMLGVLGEDVASTPLEIVLDALAYVAQRGVHPGVDPEVTVKAFFASLPGQQLKEVAEAQPVSLGLLGEKRAELVKWAKEEIVVRRIKAKQDLADAMEEVGTWRHDPDSKTVAEPEKLAFKLIEAGEHWDALMDFGGKPDLSKRVLMPVEILCQPSNLKLIDPATFRKLAGALSKLNLAEAGRGEVARELEQRRAEMHTAQMASTANVVQALMLIGDGKTLAEAVTMIRAEIRNRDGQGSYSRVKLVQQLTEHVGKLPAEKRAALSKLMSRDDMVHLGRALIDLSRSAHVKEHDSLVDELLDLGSALSALQTATGARSAVPQPPNLEELSPDVRAALEVYGIEIGTNNNANVRSGVASKALQAGVREHLARSMDDSSITGLALEVDDVDYSMNGVRIVKDREALASKKEVEPARDGQEALTERHIAVQRAFREAKRLAPTEELKIALSRVANFKAWDPIVTLMGSPNSLVRLSDGTPVQLAGERTTAFDVRSDGKGGLLVSCHLTITKPAYGVATEPGGRRRLVDVQDMPGRIFSYEVAITAGGHASLSKPVEVHPCLWAHKSYPKPRDAWQITSRHADPRLAQDFSAFSTREHNEENLTIITALNNFQNNPTVRGAQEIYRKYIAKDDGDWKKVELSDRIEANIQGHLREGVADVVREAIEKPGPHTMKKVLEQFALVHFELSSLVNKDSFRRFISQLEASALTAVTGTLEVSFDTEEAMPEVGLAPVAGEADRRTASLLNHRLKLLAAPLETADQIANAASLLPYSLPRDMPKMLTAYPPREVEFRQQFQRHLELPLKALNPVELASLLYNLETTLDKASRQEPHVRQLIEAATDARKGTRQGMMPLESVLLGARSIPINPALLVTWYDQRRVNVQEVESALARVDKAALPTLEGTSLWPFASRLLKAGDSEVQRLATNFISDATEFMNLNRGQATLTRAMVLSVVKLGGQFDRYTANRDLPGSDPERTNTDEQLQKCAQDLASTLEPLLVGFSGAGMLPKDLKAMRKALISFDAPTDEVERAIGLAAETEKALKAHLDARNILPSPSEAGMGPPPEDEVPPPPLHNDDLPPPPADDEPPPPPEDPEDSASRR